MVLFMCNEKFFNSLPCYVLSRLRSKLHILIFVAIFLVTFINFSDIKNNDFDS